MTLGAALADARRAARLSQSELARRTGVPQPQISLYESGKRMPDVVTLVTLARALGISVDELVAGIETSHPAMAPEPGEE